MQRRVAVTQTQCHAVGCAAKGSQIRAGRVGIQVAQLRVRVQVRGEAGQLCRAVEQQCAFVVDLAARAQCAQGGRAELVERLLAAAVRLHAVDR